MKRRWIQSSIFIFVMLNFCYAFAGPSTTTYQAKIVKPDGYPLESSNVNFKFTILNPAGTCILYSETYSSVNMSSTGGLISFALGAGVKTYPVSATTFEQVFSNITPTLSCDVGGPVSYSPAAADSRKIVMQFHDGAGWQTLPAMNINAVPYAMYANEAAKLEGLTAADFVQVTNLASCGANEALHYNGAGFTCVPVASSVSAAAVVSALGYTPAPGASVTALTASLSATDATVASVSTSVFSVSSTVSSLSNSVTSLESTVAASFAAITSSQWVTSGTTISYNEGSIAVSGGVRIGIDATTCGLDSAGTIRYNSGLVEYCNGTTWTAFGVAGAGITLLNGSASGTQSFVTGISGNNFNVATVNGVHSFNIPLAASGSVTAGLLSNADYVSFLNKVSATSAAVISALGFTPADTVNVTNLSSNINSVSSVVATKITSSAAAIAEVLGYVPLSPSAATQWLTSGSTISYTSGNVGVGTLAPTANFHVAGLGQTTSVIESSSDTNGSILRITRRRTTGGALLEGDYVGGVKFQGMTSAGTSTVTGAVESYVDAAPLTNKTPGRLVFSTTNTVGTTLERVRIDSLGNMGIGTTSPVAKLEVSGGVKISMEAATCAASYAGTLRYNTGNVEYCNGTSWAAFGVSTLGLTLLNGSASQTQTFATGITGTVFNITSNNGVHTFNIPLAATGSVTAGLLSNADYTSFSNKITSSAASVAQVLGYVPASATALNNYSVKANNLSDLTSSATARTNLGLGSFATASSIDLGSASATGILADARLPSFANVTSGTQYTKVTVDGKGRVTSGGQLALADVTTALGYTPAQASSATQWITNGSNIGYTTGNVGVGTTNPLAKLHLQNNASTSSALNILSNSAAIGSTNTAVNLDMSAGSVNQTNTGFNISNATSGDGSATGLNIGLNSRNNTYGVSVTATKNWFGGALTGSVMGVYSNVGTDSSLAYTYSGYFNNTASTGTVAYGLYTNINTGATDAAPFVAAVAGSEKFRISSAGNVGIGTTNPNTRLDVRGTANFQTSTAGAFRVTGVGAGYSDVVSGIFTVHSENTVGTGGNVLKASSAFAPNAFVVKDHGSVGIGVSSPGHPLDVAGTIRSTNEFISTGANQARYITGNYGVIHRNDGTNYHILLTNSGDQYGTWNSLRPFFINTATGNTTMNSLYTNAASGHVGIGTTNPTAKFEVDTTDNTEQSSLSMALVNTGTNPVNSATTKLSYKWYNTEVGAINFWRQGSSVDGGAMSFATSPNTAAPIDRLFIAAGGNIGLGTTLPNTTLDVSGALSIREMAAPALSPVNQGRIYFDATSNKFRVSENGGAYTNIATEATTSGTYVVKSGDTMTGLLQITDFAAAGTKMLAVGDDSFITDLDAVNTMGIYGNQDPLTMNLRLGASGVTLSAVGGKLGIGAVAPQALLQVGDYTAEPKTRNFVVRGGWSGSAVRHQNLISFAGTTEGTSDPVTDTTGEAAKNWHIGMMGESAFWNSSRFSFVKAGVEQMTILSTGLVGMGGASNPAAALHVKGNLRDYMVNRAIAGNTEDATGVNYILLHKAYNGVILNADYHVQGKLTALRGFGGWNRKISTEVNTATAHDATRGSIVSYNEGNRLVTLTYAGVSYLALEIVNGSSMYNMSFTGYAFASDGELLKLVYDTDVSGVTAFTGAVGGGSGGPDAITIQNKLVTGGLVVGSHGSSTTDDNADFSIKSNGQLNIQANGSGSADTAYVHLVLAAGTSTSTNSGIRMNTLGVERMRIDSNGYVGIGTNGAPNALLHVPGSAQISGIIGGENNGAGNFHLDAWSSGADRSVYLNWANGTGGAKVGNGSSAYGPIAATAFNVSSDRRLKENITAIENPLDKILKLDAVTFTWKDSNRHKIEGQRIGLIAQNVEKVFPQAVRVDKGENTLPGGTKLVSYSDLVSPIIAAIQELYRKWLDDSQELHETVEKQAREIASVKVENAKVKKENEEIKARLERLEKLMSK